MVDRINILMKAKNISARQFAEEIGIQPSGMSHILSGRNNPSLDFVMKVMRRWPEVNINWLMFGKGEMYATPPLSVPVNAVTESEVISVQEQQPETFDLFSQPELDVRASNHMVQSEGEQLSVQRTEPIVQMTEEGEGQVSIERKEELKMDPVFKKDSVSMTQPHENYMDETEQMCDRDKAILEKKKIERIVVFYSDHTFSEYMPE